MGLEVVCDGKDPTACSCFVCPSHTPHKRAPPETSFGGRDPLPGNSTGVRRCSAPPHRIELQGVGDSNAWIA